MFPLQAHFEFCSYNQLPFGLSCGCAPRSFKFSLLRSLLRPPVCSVLGAGSSSSCLSTLRPTTDKMPRGRRRNFDEYDDDDVHGNSVAPREVIVNNYFYTAQIYPPAALDYLPAMQNRRSDERDYYATGQQSYYPGPPGYHHPTPPYHHSAPPYHHLVPPWHNPTPPYRYQVPPYHRPGVPHHPVVEYHYPEHHDVPDPPTQNDRRRRRRRRRNNRQSPLTNPGYARAVATVQVELEILRRAARAAAETAVAAVAPVAAPTAALARSRPAVGLTRPPVIASSFTTGSLGRLGPRSKLSYVF